jgi:hypothetical protein
MTLDTISVSALAFAADHGRDTREGEFANAKEEL